MIGTLTNTLSILIGCAFGSKIKDGLKKEWQDALFTAMGLAACAIGCNATIQNMEKSTYPVLFIVSLSMGSLIGTILKLDEKFNAILDKPTKKRKTMNEEKKDLAKGLSTAILLFCIGTLSILGPIEAALYNNNTYLYTNATLDLITATILSSAYGIGIALSAPVLFLWQGSLFLLAKLCGSFMSDSLMTEISIIGGILIFASGLTILKIKDCKTLNMIPSLLVPIIYLFIKSFF